MVAEALIQSNHLHLLALIRWCRHGTCLRVITVAWFTRDESDIITGTFLLTR